MKKRRYPSKDASVTNFSNTSQQYLTEHQRNTPELKNKKGSCRLPASIDSMALGHFYTVGWHHL
ncbi:hypothetical protein [Flagellimonas allohymeniacidonis]|uniref:Uncharacterized protein n=1 Tax=Flagellimonas allohymeniacidonis TaxID=2517819 RepID=A0A4Q8QCM3_9FLAO|nr:hypothetical protein [Allomuricauda hymeniacidonis]TAI48091.1 hypothetical protein EW142_15705 [Allomuricauda hymeniacidonis]